MRKLAGKITVLFMAAVMMFAMAGCAVYNAPTVESFCAALDELGYREVPDATNVADINTAMMSFATFGGGGYMVSEYKADEGSMLGINGITTDVMCVTENGTRYLFLTFDSDDHAKTYYSSMKYAIDNASFKDGAFTTTYGIGAEYYSFAGETDAGFGKVYCYGAYYVKGNTVTVIDTYKNDITNKTQVNQLLDKLGLPRP